MLPPPGPFHHQSLKLAELNHAAQNAQRQPSPPPAYSTVRHDQLDEDECSPSTQLARISVCIDASLKVEGHANTIVLPPSSSHGPPPSGQQSQSQTGRRVEKLTGAVLHAFKDAGLLDSSPDMDGEMRSRPLDIHVNAATVLKGSKNTVCSGVPRFVYPSTAGTAGTAQAKAPAEEARDDSSGDSRKRRACSEPPDPSMSKTRRYSS